MIRQLIRLLLCIILVGGFHISSTGEVRISEPLSAQSKKKKEEEIFQEKEIFEEKEEEIFQEKEIF